ncbi:hypothetical protein [Paludibacterium paludis]|uniref:Phosphoglycerate mutase n=1 Tax=Paludibacterium paludis TaxID=1225769 RepID=A0A918P5P2_9NEIS|nr:hypothetical protein [Paludibacterium paludis]GGY22439.1 hypothetical protein GCM10011289_27770 [Paludibacterium paludis]
MEWILAVPGLAWPDAHDGAEVSKGLSTPALSLLLGRGARAACPGRPSRLWRDLFGIDRLAPARLAARQDGLDADAGHWLIADPVHVRVDRDRALLADVGVMALSGEEAGSLVAALGRHFAADGLSFHVGKPGRWYVQSAHPFDAEFSALTDAIGEDIDEHLPTGANGLAWCRFLNEAQMLLHSHPVNETREARGDLPVNSLWLWGEGDVPAERTSFDLVLSDDATVRLLCEAAAVPVDDLPFGFAAAEDRAGEAGRVTRCLAVPDAAEAPAQFRDAWGWREALEKLEADWFEPALLALKSGRIDALTLRTAGAAGVSVRVTRADLWKLWRRPLALPQLY